MKTGIHSANLRALPMTFVAHCLLGFALGAIIARLLWFMLTWPSLWARLRPPPVVSFDGLIEELHAKWPLDEHERCKLVALAERRAGLEHPRPVA